MLMLRLLLLLAVAIVVLVIIRLPPRLSLELGLQARTYVGNGAAGTVPPAFLDAKDDIEFAATLDPQPIGSQNQVANRPVHAIDEGFIFESGKHAGIAKERRSHLPQSDHVTELHRRHILTDARHENLDEILRSIMWDYWDIVQIVSLSRLILGGNLVEDQLREESSIVCRSEWLVTKTAIFGSRGSSTGRRGRRRGRRRMTALSGFGGSRRRRAPLGPVYSGAAAAPHSSPAPNTSHNPNASDSQSSIR